MTPDIETVFARLADVLDEERELMLSGHAAQAASLIEEKMAALQDFEGLLEAPGIASASAQVRRAAQDIIHMAEENAAHMEAIRNGLRHAISRIERLNSSANVGSYGQGGAQLSFTNATGTFSRKA